MLYGQGEEEPRLLSDEPSRCRFCREFFRITGKEVNCRQAHLYGSTQSVRFGGKYTYFCPLSLVFFTSPVIIDGLFRGALVGGPVLLVTHREFLEDDIVARFHLTGDEKNRLEETVNRLPYVSPERARALSETLLHTASWISGIHVPSFIQSEEKIRQQNRIGEYIQELKAGSETLPYYPMEKEKRLLELIARGDKAGSSAVLNEILGALYYTAGGDFEVIKIRTLELMVLLSRAALEGGADTEEIFGLNFNYLKELNRLRTVDELNQWLAKIMHRFVDFVFDCRAVGHTDAVFKAIQFIQKNFAAKLSLEDVAEHVYLSPSYFSRIFKEEMDISFKNYLNDVRIRRSRDLLVNTDLQLVDIAGAVGYEDQSYFTKVFKKICGISPGKYRETRGRMPENREEIHE